jgi:peptidoglycan hydrolase-like protein with peptidoglycan-binding domain
MSNIVPFRAASAFGQAAQAALSKAEQTALTLRKAQARLKYLGFKIDVDGRYGEQSKSAIEAFQSAVGLDVTGGLDADTLAWLAQMSPADVSDTAKSWSNAWASYKAGAGPLPTARQMPAARRTTDAPAPVPGKLALMKEGAMRTFFPADRPWTGQPGWYVLGGLIVVAGLAIYANLPANTAE